MVSLHLISVPMSAVLLTCSTLLALLQPSLSLATPQSHKAIDSIRDGQSSNIDHGDLFPGRVYNDSIDDPDRGSFGKIYTKLPKDRVLSKRDDPETVILQPTELMDLSFFSWQPGIDSIDQVQNYAYRREAGSGATIYILTANPDLSHWDLRDPSPNENTRRTEYSPGFLPEGVTRGSVRVLQPKVDGPGITENPPFVPIRYPDLNDRWVGTCFLSKIIGTKYGLAKSANVVIVTRDRRDPGSSHDYVADYNYQLRALQVIIDEIIAAQAQGATDEEATNEGARRNKFKFWRAKNKPNSKKNESKKRFSPIVIVPDSMPSQVYEASFKKKYLTMANLGARLIFSPGGYDSGSEILTNEVRELIFPATLINDKDFKDKVIVAGGVQFDGTAYPRYPPEVKIFAPEGLYRLDEEGYREFTGVECASPGDSRGNIDGQGITAVLIGAFTAYLDSIPSTLSSQNGNNQNTPTEQSIDRILALSWKRPFNNWGFINMQRREENRERYAQRQNQQQQNQQQLEELKLFPNVPAVWNGEKGGEEDETC